MSEEKPQPPEIEEELPALQKQLLSLAGIVESVFADAVVALIEGDISAANEARLEDYKAHQAWLQADTLAVDLLSTGRLTLDQVRFVCAGVKIASDLKLMADEGIRVARQMRSFPNGNVPPGPCTEVLPRMADIAQSMFSDSIESLVNEDATEAHSLHLVFRELSSLNRELQERVNEDLASDGKLPPPVGTCLVLVGRSLEAIGERALDIAGHVTHLYPAEENTDELQAEAE